jgi:hypothetical protein
MAQENLQSLYKQALSKLAEGQSAQAQKELENIYAQGWRSAGIEHFLGRSLIANKEFGKGILHLYQAQKLDRSNGDIRNDLELAEKLVPGSRGTRMEHPSEWAFNIGTYVRAEEQFYFAAFLGVALLLARYFKKLSKQQSAAWLSLIVLIVGLATFTSFGRSFAVVLQDSPLKEAAFDAAESVQSAPSGARVRIIRRNEDYSEVERVGAFRGWVKNADLAQLN